MAGITADQLYEQIVNFEIESRLFGENWCESTQNFWLAWSLFGAIGYSLPIKSIAHDLRNFCSQFEAFNIWSIEHSINPHVLICGLIGIVFSVILFSELKKSTLSQNSEYKISMRCFFILPFIGLAILSYRYEWNYLLYHSHTYEFFMIYSIPSFIIFSHSRRIPTLTILLIGVFIAFPLSRSLENSTNSLIQKVDDYRSQTEIELGLSADRFSAAINAVEENSQSVNDIIYFLPDGGMNDLIIRTKMRTFATHFAGDNFPNIRKLTTTQPLNIYFLYDASLDKIPTFKNSLLSKFPQANAKTRIYSGTIIAEKIELSVSPNS